MNEIDKVKNEIEMNLSETIISLGTTEKILLLAGKKESEAMEVLQELDTELKSTLNLLNRDDPNFELLVKQHNKFEDKMNLLSVLAKEGV